MSGEQGCVRPCGHPRTGQSHRGDAHPAQGDSGAWDRRPLPPPGPFTGCPAELGAVVPRLAETSLPPRGVIWNFIPSGRKWEILKM